MSNWRDRPDAWPTLSVAARETDIREDILEKDYWVTQVLRITAERFPDDFVFKGGTSLSKAYRCVQRFSEDIDVLILKGGRGKAATSTLMKSIVDAATSELGLEPDESRHQHGTGTHLTEYLQYPGQAEEGVQLEPVVMLEMGVRGRDEPPHRVVPVEPLIAEALRRSAIELADYADLAPCEVPVLHPGRTLVEKVMMLHFKVTTGVWNSGDKYNKPSRVGRHYHDIQSLLGLEEVHQWLDDREAFFAAIESHEEVNRDEFGNDIPPRPDGGYAMSDAFRLDFDGNAQLADFYRRAMDELFLGPGDPPEWEALMETIQSSADLL
jgi:hypothetical protein